jgi:alanine racemase
MSDGVRIEHETKKKEAMTRPIHAIIHTQALRHNLLRVRQAAPDSKVMSVVKANAYGHGLARVFEGLRASDAFALLDLAEAATLRELGWRGPILLLEGVFDARDLELCSSLDLWHVVHCSEQIDMLAAHKTSHAHRVFLKLNSGMNRLGFRSDQFRAAWSRLNAMAQVGEVSLMTHFSDADTDKGIADQLKQFRKTAQDLSGEICLSNSAAILRHMHSGTQALVSDWVRPGIVLYGASPDYPQHSAQDWAVAPAMSLRTRIVALQDLKAGDSVGYGSAFKADKAMRIGVVACGYADGYMRSSPGSGEHGTPVLVDGVRTRTIGRVSMDLLTVDLSQLPDSGVGSEVTLWGRSSQGALLPIDEVAAAAGTVGYELMCALAARVAVTVQD